MASGNSAAAVGYCSWVCGGSILLCVGLLTFAAATPNLSIFRSHCNQSKSLGFRL